MILALGMFSMFTLATRPVWPEKDMLLDEAQAILEEQTPPRTNIIVLPEVNERYTSSCAWCVYRVS